MSSLHVCSFHDLSGSAHVGYREVHWDFSFQFGPLFVSKEGVPWENQPKVTSREWKAFEQWFAELKAERTELGKVKST